MTPAQEAVEVLKTSVFTHIMQFNGPTAELCKRMLKLIDLIEDTDESRRYNEINQLSELIIKDILEDEAKWHESADPTSMSARNVRKASESTTMSLQEKLKVVSMSARDRALLTTSSQKGSL
jgi:hypothetical protein